MNQTIRSFKNKRSSISLIKYKYDEKLLSESLYRNLHVLQRFHNATPDFLNIYKLHMFIKPNPEAFLHVFHFIFNCLDAAEFKKRFHWPIYGKVNETCFRNRTLDYINRLNIIHQLGFETLKLHNIYTPGGFNFIKIVHKLSFLAMKLSLTKHTGSIPNVNDIPDANDQLEKLEETIDNGFDFVARLEAKSELLREKTDEINKTIMSFFQGSTTFGTKRQCWSCLAEQWHIQLDHVVENDVKPQLQRVAMTSKICADFDQLLTKLFVDRKKNIIEYDKAKLAIAQKVLVKWNPGLQEAIIGMIQNNSINFEGLQAIEYESAQIDVMNTKASQVQNQIGDFEQEVLPFLLKNEEKFRNFCLNLPNLPFTVMETPIVVRNSDNLRQRKLMDVNPSRVKLFNETLSFESHTINNFQNINDTIGAECSSMQNKARNDALQILLKTKISKGKAIQSFSNISCLKKACTPRFSTAICSTAIKNHEKKYHENELKISPLFPNAQLTRKMSKNATFLSPNSTAIKKISTNSKCRLDHTDLRGSPTRRWVYDKIVDVHQDWFVPTPLNGNHDHIEAQVEIENVMGLNEEEFLENISDSILKNFSN